MGLDLDPDNLKTSIQSSSEAWLTNCALSHAETASSIKRRNTCCCCQHVFSPKTDQKPNADHYS